MFTRFPDNGDLLNPTTAEVFTINADGTGLTQLTFNSVEERAPAQAEKALIPQGRTACSVGAACYRAALWEGFLFGDFQRLPGRSGSAASLLSSMDYLIN